MEPICIIKEIYKTLYQFEKTFAEAHDITINEAMLLCCLKSGEAKSAGSICEYIGLSNSRVSKVITAVENKGYIRRDINRDDKRQMFFSLTEAGMEKARTMMHSELRFSELFEQLKPSLKSSDRRTEDNPPSEKQVHHSFPQSKSTRNTSSGRSEQMAAGPVPFDLGQILTQQKAAISISRDFPLQYRRTRPSAAGAAKKESGIHRREFCFRWQK